MTHVPAQDLNHLEGQNSHDETAGLQVTGPQVVRSAGGHLRLLGTMAVVGLAATTLTGLATGAFFTDTQAITANAFTTGTVKLGVTPATAAVTAGNLAPGDNMYGQVTVSNTGTLSERYSVLGTSDATDNNFLAAQLQLTIKTGVTSCTAAGFGAAGSAVVSGPTPFGSTTGTKLLGDAATGTQAGDRTLAAGATENLCIQVSLPSVTGNPYQGKSTTAVFRFDSEQTANNP